MVQGAGRRALGLALRTKSAAKRRRDANPLSV